MRGLGGDLIEIKAVVGRGGGHRFFSVSEDCQGSDPADLMRQGGDRWKGSWQNA